MTTLNKLLLLLILCIQPLAIAKADIGKKNMYPNGKISDDKLDDFIGRAKKILQKKYKLSICAVGGGVRDKIWLVDLSFNRYGSPLTEVEIRKLLIAITEDLLDIANKDEKLRPHMESYPFTPKNVSVSLFNYSKNGENYPHPYITSSVVSKGNVLLISLDPKNNLLQKADIYETYEETLAIVAKENQSK